MIVFDLSCEVGGHRFEAWFASSDSFADQQARGLIGCPICGDSKVKKAVMAPRLGAKANRQVATAASQPLASEARDETAPELARRMVAAIAAKQAEMLPHSRWVGRDFAKTARAMSEGRAPEALIHGEASAEDAQALRDDGIAAMPLLVPIVPPEAAN